MAVADPTLLVVLLSLIAAFTLALAPRVRSVEGFFLGHAPGGEAPGMWTLALSQVTTWIFARSLLNAGILGYFYGIGGAVAYAAYYGSFLTGGWIVDRLRFHHRVGNIQEFLRARFGRLGTVSFNLLIGLRLLSEVFANLLVVGIVFGAAGSDSYSIAILAVVAVTLAYSMLGGLHASLRTDVVQCVLLVALLSALTAIVAVQPEFSLGQIASSTPDPTSPGWVLLVVALLQIVSYPMHDPVMMDRGFLADRRTTRRSFLHAFWISSLMILAFGVVGVFAGLQREGTEALLETLARLFGTPVVLLVGVALVVSAASTLDSTFASAAKLAVMDMGIGRPSAGHGRLAMLLFAAGGVLLVFVGSDDLFAAVAVSGTASLFLAPVVVFSIGAGRTVSPWAYAVTVLAAIGASVVYFLETSGHVNWIGMLTGLGHSYAKLLAVTVAVLGLGMGSFALAMRPRSKGPAGPAAGGC